MTSTFKPLRSHKMRDRIRAYMADHGVAYNIARRACEADEATTTATPAKATKDVVNAEGLPWQHLYGRYILVDDATIGEGKIPRQFGGLCLPPEPGSRRAAYRLRVLPTGRQQPILIDARDWTIKPNPATLDGPPAFDNGKKLQRLPDGLETANMLRQRWRKAPADKQQPAGTYHGEWGTAEVYWADDAAPLPELTGKRATTWQANRTCADCGTQSLDVVPKRDDGLRRCHACTRAQQAAEWIVFRDTHRQAVVAWARAVLADPTTALLAIHADRDDPTNPRTLRAETPDGTLLFEVELPRGITERAVTEVTGESGVTRRVFGDYLHPERLAALAVSLSTLHGRRLVPAVNYELVGVDDILNAHAAITGTDPVTLPYPRDLTGFSDQYRWWTATVAGTAHIGHYGHPVIGPTTYPHFWKPEHGATAEQILSTVRAGLTDMATGQPPADTDNPVEAVA